MLKEEGYKLMGAAFEVYNQLGYGMAEEIYQQSLEIELELRGIPLQSKCELTVFYKTRQLETSYRPDLIVFDAVVVELKAVGSLNSDHEAQLFNGVLSNPVDGGVKKVSILRRLWLSRRR